MIIQLCSQITFYFFINFYHPFLAESLPNWLCIFLGDAEFRETELRITPLLLFSLFFWAGKLQRLATVLSCYKGNHSPI